MTTEENEIQKLLRENRRLAEQLAEAEARAAEAVELREAKAATEREQEILRKLSTPVLQVRDGLLIVPLIGPVDPARARQLTSQVLGAIRQTRARAVVVDVTGVPAMDSTVANYLIQTVGAARLLGAEVIISGISAGLAATLVALGVGFQTLKTHGDLQSAIEEAERLLGADR